MGGPFRAGLLYARVPFSAGYAYSWCSMKAPGCWGGATLRLTLCPCVGHHFLPHLCPLAAGGRDFQGGP